MKNLTGIFTGIGIIMVSGGLFLTLADTVSGINLIVAGGALSIVGGVIAVIPTLK